MTRKAPDQEKGKLEFVRNVREIDEDFERVGFMFLALELEEIPPAPRTRPARRGKKIANKEVRRLKEGDL